MLSHVSAITPECWGKSKLLKKLLLAGRMGSLVAVQAKRSNKGTIPLSKNRREYNFWARCKYSEFECWNWNLHKDKNGYGLISWKSNKKMRSHRVAWQIVVGKIPKGMLVCHHCDNPSCIRPSHLFLGTPKQNSEDMKKKGRSQHLRGVDKWSAKLTPKDVLKIRKIRKETKMTCKEIASDFGVAPNTISGIVNNQKWSWVK